MKSILWKVCHALRWSIQYGAPYNIVKCINVASWYIWNKYKQKATFTNVSIAMNNKFLNLYRENLQHGWFIDCEDAICSTKVKSIERNISNSKATEIILRSTHNTIDCLSWLRKSRAYL